MATEGDGYLKEVESPTTLKRVLQFEVPRERVEGEIEDIITGIRREISMPGFRKGKAPLDLVRARFAETAQKEAIEKLIPEAYQKALRAESLRPAGSARCRNSRRTGGEFISQPICEAGRLPGSSGSLSCAW